MSQEAILKDELKETRRSNDRADGLNLEYLKNVVFAFLIKVYGDADNEEHIKLARVLETLLHFSPDEKARLAEKLEYYESSWWHATSNFLKPTVGADLTERSAAADAPSAAPPSTPGAAPAPNPGSGSNSWWPFG